MVLSVHYYWILRNVINSHWPCCCNGDSHMYEAGICWATTNRPLLSSHNSRQNEGRNRTKANPPHPDGVQNGAGARFMSAQRGLSRGRIEESSSSRLQFPVDKLPKSNLITTDILYWTPPPKSLPFTFSRPSRNQVKIEALFLFSDNKINCYCFKE